MLVRVSCENIEAVWQAGTTSDLNNSMDVWKIRLPADLEIPTYLEAVLNPEEHLIATRFHQAKDRQNFIIRRGALRILLARYLGVTAQEVEFMDGGNKKPILKDKYKSIVHFNVSHSGDWALIGISDHELGVDIEAFKESFDYQEILHHGFSKQEIEFITNADSPIIHFFKLWTRKEAMIKATSKGVDDDLEFIPVLNGSHDVSSELLGSQKNWYVKSFAVEKTCLASIAHSQYNLQIKFLNFPITNNLL